MSFSSGETPICTHLLTPSSSPSHAHLCIGNRSTQSGILQDMFRKWALHVKFLGLNPSSYHQIFPLLLNEHLIRGSRGNPPTIEDDHTFHVYMLYVCACVECVFMKNCTSFAHIHLHYCICISPISFHMYGPLPSLLSQPVVVWSSPAIILVDNHHIHLHV